MKLEVECDPIMTSRFYDGELNPEERNLMEGHLKNCSSCRRSLRNHQILSDAFNEKLDEGLESAETGLERMIIDKIDRAGKPWPARILDMIPAKKYFIPAAATAMTVAVISATVFTSNPSGPSAIVTSFKGDVSSVMFLETAETRQTIIWYTEPVVGES